MNDWVDTAQGVASIAEALAIFVGGLWAYFKFIRGRTFAWRAEVTLGASVVSSGDATLMKVAVTLRNTGASKIPLAKGLNVVYLYSAKAATPTENIDWGDHVTVTRILTEHRWLEAQEVITDELLIPLADGATKEPALAHKVVCKVLANGRFWRKDIQWTANAVIPVDQEERR